MKRLLLTLAFVGPAHAEFVDGNKLLSRIDNSSSYYEQGAAMGYIMGVADTGLGILHCAPPNVTAGQLQDMVRNYLINVPAQRHQSADILINRVLKATWPCPDRPAGRPL
jgi:hypothetical protein